jgi:antitoxin component YwqK of YwqJK toxin-antitoxin module
MTAPLINISYLNIKLHAEQKPISLITIGKESYLWNFEDYSNLARDTNQWIRENPMVNQFIYIDQISDAFKQFMMNPPEEMSQMIIQGSHQAIPAGGGGMGLSSMFGTNLADTSAIGRRVDLDGSNFDLPAFDLNDSNQDARVKGTLLFSSGEKMYQGELLGKKRDGYGKLYHKTGVLRYEGFFKEDRIHANNIKTYHENGALKFEGEMIEGKKEGPGKWYYNSGQLWFEGKFQNDKFHEPDCQTYHHNGQKRYKGGFIEGQKEGKGMWWHDTGNLWYDGVFKEDKFHGENVKSYHPNGNLRFEGIYEAGKKQGQAKYYHDNGGLWFEGNFKDDKFHDIDVTTFHPSGNRKYIGNFVDGLKQGPGLLHYETGALWFEGNF